MNSFNNIFINNWKDLNHSVVGLEFEFFSNYPLIKTMELLNLEFSPIEIHFANQYHSNFEIDDKVWVCEPDFSGGSDMVELITGPLLWIDARLVLIKMLEFIKKHGYTTEHCSIHINISFDDKKMFDLNELKLIMSFNEDYVYEKFPNRRNNIYARSIKWILPFEDWDQSDVALKNMLQSIILPNDTKYYGINFRKKDLGYLEFRYIGGENYENKSDDIINLMEYFILQTRNAISEEFTQEDTIKLLSYLDDNINWFKKYKTYNEFLANIEGINIEVDKSNDYNNICNNWDKFKNDLFIIIKSCDSIKNATINYNTLNNRLEIIEGIISGIAYVKNADFIECTINDYTLYYCDIIDCEMNNGHLFNCNIYESKINNTKLDNCLATEWSELINCMFTDGTINCVMKGGVFRSGYIGEDADIENTVKMSFKSDFWSINPKDKKIK